MHPELIILTMLMAIKMNLTIKARTCIITSDDFRCE